MSKIASRVAFIAICTPLLVGCAPVPKVAQQKPLKPGPRVQPVMLKKVVAKPQRGATIGNIYGGLAHVWQMNLVWQGGRIAMDPSEFSEELRRQFESNNLTVVGDPTALFEDPSEWKAEYMIGALVKDIKMDLWYPWCGYGNWNTGSGHGYVEVEWQIYARRSRSVELKVTTKGSAHDVKITDLGPSEPLLRAFGAAAKNLMADQKFMGLVAPQDEGKPSEALAPILVKLVKSAPKADSPQAAIDHARLSVLTVFAGPGHGSGFIISQDGYVLTNQHVVGEARNVTAKTLTGRELQAEVVRIDRIRDVALLKLEQDQYQPLVLGDSSAVRPGENVYAIGSPKTEDLGQSVTAGVVSGFRSMDDQRFIQSDVTVNAGNSGGPLLSTEGIAIGIAVLRRGDAEGINFFVPIEEAISALAITDASGGAAATSKPAAQ